MPATPSRSVSDPRTLVTHPEIRSQRSFPFFKTVGEPKKNALERLLSLFADVRAGEGVGALLLMLNIFLILEAYYLIKPVREALVLTEPLFKGVSTPEQKAYSSAAQAVLLMGVVPLYGWLATRVPRMRLIAITSLFFALNLGLFYLAGQAGLRVGVAFFIWIGIFNVFVPAQFWGFANDLYTEGQGQRLFPLIGVGASLGAWAGASAVPPLLRQAGFTPYTLMVISGGILLVALVITVFVNRRETARAEPEAKKINEAPLGRQGGFELILKDRYLTWIAVLIVLLNIVNSTGGFLLDNVVTAEAAARVGTGPGQEAAAKAFISAFFGTFYAVQNLLGLLLQLFVTSRVIRFMGVRGALFILPVLALINYSVIAVAPILAVVRVGKLLENSTDYSIQNTIRAALFLPTSREAKYKSKAAIDTFFARTGDMVQGGFVAAGAALGIAWPAFAWLNVGLTGAWLVAAGRIAREHRRKTL
jgi:AAA family ATP:ADP antiporter